MKTKSKQNQRYIFAIMLVFPVIFLMSLKISHSLSLMGGYAIDSTLWALSDYFDDYYQVMATFVDIFLYNSFSPDFTTILELEARADIAGVNPAEWAYTKEMVQESFLFGSLLPKVQFVAAALATVLMLFGMILCLAGKSNQIRDTPIRILGAYVFVLVMDYIAFGIIYEIVDAIRNVWVGFVITPTKATLFSEMATNITSINDSECTILGTTATIPTSVHLGAISCGGPIITFILFWKLLKQFIKLYLEVAERYFVLMVLVFFFPVSLATIVNGNSRNIFSSYLRMLLSQTFIIMANMLFIKFFIFVGHGWLKGFINYIAALAFLRVCQRIDAYMLSMGLNVAQTGAGLASSMRGAGLGLMYAARSLSSLGSARKNIGNAIAASGVAANNFDMYQKGINIAGHKTAGNMANPILSFEQAMSKANPASTGIHSFGAGNFDDAAKHLNIPSTQKGILQNAGINPNTITGVEVSNKTGAITYSDTNGRVGTYYNGKMLKNNMRDSELDFFSQRSAIVNDAASPELAKKAIIDRFGSLENKNVSALSQSTLLDQYGSSRGYENCKITRGPSAATSVGASSATITGSYIKDGTRQAASTQVDMFNVAQYPETLENRGKRDWKYIEENDQGFMVHEHANTFADDLNQSSHAKQFSTSENKDIESLKKSADNSQAEQTINNARSDLDVKKRKRNTAYYGSLPTDEEMKMNMAVDQEIGTVMKQFGEKIGSQNPSKQAPMSDSFSSTDGVPSFSKLASDAKVDMPLTDFSTIENSNSPVENDHLSSMSVPVTETDIPLTDFSTDEDSFSPVENDQSFSTTNNELSYNNSIPDAEVVTPSSDFSSTGNSASFLSDKNQTGFQKSFEDSSNPLFNIQLSGENDSRSTTSTPIGEPIDPHTDIQYTQPVQNFSTRYQSNISMQHNTESMADINPSNVKSVKTDQPTTSPRSAKREDKNAVAPQKKEKNDSVKRSKQERASFRDTVKKSNEKTKNNSSK